MADEYVSEISRKEIKRPSGILRYGRDELLGLQEAYGETQEEWWMQLLKDLGADVAEELHELQVVSDASRFRRRSKNSERRQRSKAKRDALHALSINSLENRDGREEYANCHEDSSDSSWHKVDENFGGHSHARKRSWNNRMFYSEDKPEAESFQPPAFAVEGEPDFESGPPQDGWEYLRRVKYEAARCPKVVVAEIDPTKLISEQTPYMPEVQEIPVCPPDLLPSKEWEEHFLKDFSLLRMALSSIHVPPKSALDRIPSLRNKAAWEVRCFGSITSMHENSKDLDIVRTEEETADPGEKESADEARSPSLASLDSAQNIRESVASESRLQPVDIEKDHPVPFIELVETQLNHLFNTGPVEANYVIDLKLLNTQVPLFGERERSFHEAEYLISGELVEAHDVNDVRKWAYSSVGIHEPEDDPVTSMELANSYDYDAEELGHTKDSFNGIKFQFDHLIVGEPEGQLGNIEHAKASSSDLSPDDNKSADLTTPVFMASVADGAHTSVHVEVETEAQAEHLPTMEVEDAADGIECMESLSSYFDVVELVNDQLITAGFMESLDGYAQHLDQIDFQETCTGIDTQFEYLTIGEPEGVQSEMEVMLPSYAYLESPKFEDAHLPNEDFMESLVGLEIYCSGNILQDEPDDERIGAPGFNSEFKIDESLEELFTKVFQLVGVSQLPFIRLLLRLDEVSRAALLRYHVSWLENVDGLPQDRALWLLTLSAVVDTPLDAQTSAAFRAVLRHCAGIRALKQTRDDEDLYMLNALITVAGIYFGQAETTVS